MADRDRSDQNGSRRGPLIALIVIGLLIAAGWVLYVYAHANLKLENCLLSGRTNCEPIPNPGH